MNAETEHRLCVAAERIGTGLLRLAAAEEARREDDRPRDVFGIWLRPSQIDALGPDEATPRGGYPTDVVKIRLRSGQHFIVWRKQEGPWGARQYVETEEELLTRVLRALGWQP